jgi:transposase
MKSSELSGILLSINELLSLYPDADLKYILDDLKQLKTGVVKTPCVTETKPAKIDEKELKKGIDRLVENVESLTLNEIEEKLKSEEMFPSMEYIRYFAKKLGMDLTTRQSRANSIHTIQRHVDRLRIDKTISKRSD